MTFATTKFRSLLPAATFAMLVEFLMGLLSMVVAGHLLGEEALSAVNLMQPVFNIVSFFALMVGTGSSVLFSTAIGGFQERRAHELFTQGLLSAVGIGSLLLIVLAVVRGPVLSSLGASEAVTTGAQTYWLWFLPAAVLRPVAYFLGIMCYSDGDEKICYASYAVLLCGNLAVSIICTKAFGDLSGCALGMSVGNLLSIIVLSAHFFRKGNNLRLVRHFSLKDTFRICWCAVGDAALKLCYAVLFFLLNAYIIGRFGSEQLPVLSAVIAVMAIAEVFDGVSMAVQPLAGVYIGERNDVRTRSVMTTSVKVAVGEGLVVTMILLAAPSLIVRLVGISDPALVGVSETAVRLSSLGLVATGLMMLFNSYYMFIDREVLAAAITVFTMLVFPAAMFPVLGEVMGLNGVWLSMGLAPTLAVLIASLVICWKWGRSRFPYLLDPSRGANIRVFDLCLDPVEVCATAAAVEAHLKLGGLDSAKAVKASLLLEETLMVVRDRNEGRRILSEVTVDRNDGLSLIIRDDGELFNITDADARISSLRGYLVSNLMTAIPNRRNLTTTGFNRNVFKL